MPSKTDLIIDDLIDQLVVLRERSGLSQTGLADVMGISRPAVWRMENRVRGGHRAAPALDTFVRYCQAVGARICLCPGVVVTTGVGLSGLPVGVVVRSAAGTIAARFDAERGVVFGDQRTFPWERLELPVTVLWDPRVDREQLWKTAAHV